MRKLEFFLEKMLFASRWVLAPFYFGLVASIFVLLWYFGVEFVHLIHVLISGEGSLIVGILSLVDLVFLANLLIIIIFSGYENFVSKMDTGDSEDRPDWMGHMDFADLKMKLIGSMIAISGIELLRAFFNANGFSNTEMAWKVGVHVTFVVTGLIFAIMDKLGENKKHGAGS